LEPQHAFVFAFSEALYPDVGPRVLNQSFSGHGLTLACVYGFHAAIASRVAPWGAFELSGDVIKTGFDRNRQQTRYWMANYRGKARPEPDRSI
jgi:hypothetical protein